MAPNSKNLLYLFCLLLICIPKICKAQTLFVFGDSLYDVGNKKYLTLDPIASTYWPYGLSVDNPTGRWSDGHIVPDFLAEFMGIPFVPPSLDTTANFSHGVNYAVADATVLGSPLESLSLSDQVIAFTETKNTWSSTKLANAIYLFYIGANDYLNFSKRHLDSTVDDQIAFVSDVIQQIEASLLAIYNAGGRKFAFQNLAPLGCLPIVKQEYKSGNSCVALPSSMAARHNSALLTTLKKLETNLEGFKFIVLDYYSSTLRRMSKPENFRYFMADISCCGTGSHNAYGCGFKNVHSKLCQFQRGYLFWDGRHNAQKSNEALAHLFWSADPTVISPMNLRELFVYPTKVTIGLEFEKLSRNGFEHLK